MSLKELEYFVNAVTYWITVTKLAKERQTPSTSWAVPRILYININQTRHSEMEMSVTAKNK